MTRAAARRFLLTLEDLGYARSTDRRFSLTPRVLELGYSYLSSLTLPEIAQPHLRELVEQVHESSSVSVLGGRRDRVRRTRAHAADHDGRDRRRHALSRVRHVDGPGALGGSVRQRARGILSLVELRPLTSETVTDIDALRAELGRVGRQGWAIVDQELEHGLRSVAAPIR